MTNEQQLPTDLLMRLRSPMPKRALLYSEALTIAKLQALRARSLLHITAPSADLKWVLRVPNLVVKMLPKHEIRELTGAEASGITKRMTNGDYFMGINKNAAHTHRRFTVAHELKHLIDYPYHSILYGQLGRGDKELQHRLRERICDQFAAHFLVPDRLLKQAWTSGLQDLSALAGLFTVSEETMQIRLENEGFLEDNRPPEVFLRRVGLVPELEQLPYTAAA